MFILVTIPALLVRATYKREQLVGGLLVVSELVPDHPDRRHGRQAGLTLEQQLKDYILSARWRQRRSQTGPRMGV